MTANRLLRCLSPRRANLEINSLVIWVVLLVFLVLMVLAIVAIKGGGSDILGGLCSKSGGLFGC